MYDKFLSCKTVVFFVSFVAKIIVIMSSLPWYSPLEHKQDSLQGKVVLQC